MAPIFFFFTLISHAANAQSLLCGTFCLFFVNTSSASALKRRAVQVETAAMVVKRRGSQAKERNKGGKEFHCKQREGKKATASKGKKQERERRPLLAAL